MKAIVYVRIREKDQDQAQVCLLQGNAGSIITMSQILNMYFIQRIFSITGF